MKKFTVLVCLLSANLLFSSCAKTATETNITTNQTTAATPAPTIPATPAAPVAGTKADDQMYAAIEDESCRAYLASIKIVSDCKTVTQAERDKFAQLHTKTLESVKKPIANEQARKMRAEICLQTNNGMQKLVSQCRQ